jgi:hypothetical protein
VLGVRAFHALHEVQLASLLQFCPSPSSNGLVSYKCVAPCSLARPSAEAKSADDIAVRSGVKVGKQAHPSLQLLQNATAVSGGNALAADGRELQEKIGEHGLKPD